MTFKAHAKHSRSFFICYGACLALFVCVAALGLVFGVSSASRRMSAAEVLPAAAGAPLHVADLDTPLPAAPAVSARAAALIDAKSGALLFGKNIDERLPMASTTKIMTALVVLETLPLDKIVTVPAEATRIEGSSIYLRANEEITVEDLLYGLLLESGNDAAHTLAIACSGDIGSFAEQMNARAAALGLQNTSFQNPHGLTAEGHFTTAEELAYITAAALQNPVFSEMVATQKKVVPARDGSLTRYFSNHNKLLRYYDSAVGVKTGYTKAAGRCLVSAAERDGRLFVAVTLDDGNDWKDHTGMLDYAFENYETIEIAAPGSFGVYIGGVRYANPDGVYLTVPLGERPLLSYVCDITGELAVVHYYADGSSLGQFYLSPAGSRATPDAG